MSNDMVERLNSTVMQILCTFSENLKYKWKDSLNKLVYAYKCTKHSVTGSGPYFLLCGRIPSCQLKLYLVNIKNQKIIIISPKNGKL